MSLQSFQERLEDMISRGYRPRVKTHIALVTWTEGVDPLRNEMIDTGWQVLPTGSVYGWQVDAFGNDGRAAIVGAVCKTLEEALVDTELRIDERQAR